MTVIDEMPTDPRWDEFERKYPGHPALAEDAIYAIPSIMAKALQEFRPKARNAEPFFNDDQLQFELDLAELGGAGFFLTRPIRYFSSPNPTKSLSKTEAELELDNRHRQSAENIKQMLEEGRGPSEWTRQQEQERNADLDANLEQCQLGYAAWLVTNAGFVRARENLREQWASDIESLGRFPRIPLTMTGTSNSITPEGFENLFDDFNVFYQLWGLESFATWDLPVPMKADLVSPTLYDAKSTLSAGSTFFVPWFMMRAKDMKLKDLMQRRMTTTPPEHLLEWIEARNNPNKFGPSRFATMLHVYIYVELALRHRYSDQYTRQIQRIDETLNAYFGLRTGGGSVDKIRQEMERRLNTLETE